jgi:hypothetical protein
MSRQLHFSGVDRLCRLAGLNVAERIFEVALLCKTVRECSRFCLVFFAGERGSRMVVLRKNHNIAVTTADFRPGYGIRFVVERDVKAA